MAPRADAVAVAAGGDEVALEALDRGVFEVTVAVDHGADHLFSLDGGRERLPDPCSRHQPRGVRAPALASVRSLTATLAQRAARAAPVEDLVIYELHVGAFTAEGTFDASAGELERLRTLDVGAVELMPVAEFPGERGWGYDGVYASAAHHATAGRPRSSASSTRHSGPMTSITPFTRR